MLRRLPRTRSAARARAVRASAAVVAAVALGVTACAADPAEGEGGAAEAPADPAATDLGAKPDLAAVLDPDRGDPPAELVVEDLVVGDGNAAAAGWLVSVHYVGASWDSGEQFDASWDRGQPFAFELGAGRVIAGWEQGVAGMRVGGRRVLTIPPELAYGDRGAAGVIGPGETLVFVIDLLEVAPATG